VPQPDSNRSPTIICGVLHFITRQSGWLQR